MQREKIQLIRDGLETAYVNGNTASELLYKPNYNGSVVKTKI